MATADMRTRDSPLVRAGLCPAAVAVAAGMLATTAVSAVLAGCLPIAFSIAIVFLFAGPHNWFETRYFLARMPPRWGRLRTYFLTGIAGVLGLTGALIAMPLVPQSTADPQETWYVLLAVWNTLAVVWVGRLAALRAGQNPRRHWPWIWPIALATTAAAWLAPLGWSLALVYLHPLVSLAFLDVEIGRRRPDLQPTYRRCLLAIPIAVAVLGWRLADAPDLPGADVLTAQITAHAGAGIVPHLSTHFLVAAHTFLEMLHYATWCLLLPVVTGGVPWRLAELPLARRSAGWRAGLAAVIATGGLLVVLLWIGFLVDYPLTRSVYFTVALLHVLAEIPFLLREL